MSGLENASQGFIDYGDGFGFQEFPATSNVLTNTYSTVGRYTVNVKYLRNGDTYYADPQEIRVTTPFAIPVLITDVFNNIRIGADGRTRIEFDNFTAEPTGFLVERSLNGLDTWDIVTTLDSNATFFAERSSSNNLQTFYYRITTVVGNDTATPDTAMTDPVRFSSTANDQLAATASIVNSPDLGVKLEFFNEYLVDSGKADPTYTVFRKLQGEENFPLIPTATFRNSEFPDGWTDNGVTAGQIYDYEIRRVGEDFNGTPIEGLDGTAILSVAVDAGAERHERRGSIILAIDDRYRDSLKPEIDRLTSDLIGDGYFVIHEYVQQETDQAAESEAALLLRDRIIDIYRGHEGTIREVRSVLLLGDIPVPRAGFIDPGGHEDYRAVAADILYGDVDAMYTDIGSNILTGNETNTGESIVSDFPNRPEDGRYDQNILYDDGDGSPLELSVGRVDVSNLPSARAAIARDLGYDVDNDPSILSNPANIELFELELLRSYLNKDHAFRTGIVDVENAAIVRDALRGSPTDSRSNAYAIVGRDNTHIRFAGANVSDSSSNNIQSAIQTGNFSQFTERESFLFGLFGGGGNVDNIRFTVSSQDLATGSSQVVFNRFSGSFSFQYDDEDSLLRSAIADHDGLGLTSIWSLRSDSDINSDVEFGGYSFHGTGVGGTIGESYLTTVNQGSDLSGDGNAFVFTNLQGDPTLRAHVVDAPSGTEVSNVEGGVNVTWEYSAEDTNNGGELDAGYDDGQFLGYHIYRAESFDEEFTRVTDADGNDLFTQSDIVINGGSADDVWMVRAVKREVTNSGAYINLSQGAFSQAYSLDSHESSLT